MTNRILVAVLTLAVAVLPLAASAGEVGQRVANEQSRISQACAAASSRRSGKREPDGIED